MIDRARPFVLLDDARGGADAAPARLYRDPVEIVVAETHAAIPACLARLRAAAPLHAAGYLAYEAGAVGEPIPPPRTGDGSAPLLWFGLFERCERIDDVAGLLPDPAGGWAGTPVPLIARDAYEAALERLLALIAAGDIYQANLTFQADCPVAGDPLALYARLRPRAAAGYGGIVHDGRRTLLSFSPELFFALDGDRLTARPMKGTARRGEDPAADAAATRALADDPKQRAENLMIVDLLRNDLARVAVPGSVAVPRLFEVETYPTIHQMTSTVEARLEAGRDAVSVLEACFPCGSITGAPKLRAMEIVAAVEPDPRGVYTGAIGRIDPDGDAAFNVAIRTLTLDPAHPGRARLGLGSGVVADSKPAAEWDECLAKGGFAACAPFDLIETMRFDPREGLIDLDRHMARLGASMAAFGFAMNRHAVRNELQAATFRLRDAACVRLRVGPRGQTAVEVRPAPAALAAPLEVPLVPLPVSPEDYRLRHKTAQRGFYGAARAAAGAAEVVFVRPDGLVTEGSWSSLFVRRGARLLTPPLALGLLPGVLRARLIGAGEAVESPLTAADLRDGFLLGNALRGLFEARLPSSAT